MFAIIFSAAILGSMPPNMTIDGVAIHDIGHRVYVEDITGEPVAVEINPIKGGSFYRIFRTDFAIKVNPQKGDKRISQPWDYGRERDANKRLGEAIIRWNGRDYENYHMLIPQKNQSGVVSSVINIATGKDFGVAHPRIFIEGEFLHWDSVDGWYHFADEVYPKECGEMAGKEVRALIMFNRLAGSGWTDVVAKTVWTRTGRNRWQSSPVIEPPMDIRPAQVR